MTSLSDTNPDRIAYITKLVVNAYGSKKKAIKSIERQITYYHKMGYENRREVDINMTYRILDYLRGGLT